MKKTPSMESFIEEKEECFTDAEWEELCERWGQVANKHKYSFADKVAFWFFGFCILYLLLQLLRAFF